MEDFVGNFRTLESMHTPKISENPSVSHQSGDEMVLLKCDASDRAVNLLQTGGKLGRNLRKGTRN